MRRDRSWYALLRGMRVSIDGKRVGRIAAGETRSFPVDQGRHRVRIGIDWISSRDLDVVVPPDSQVRCRAGFRAFALTLIRPRKALQLDTADSVKRRTNPALLVLGIASWVVIYAGIFLVVVHFVR